MRRKEQKIRDLVQDFYNDTLVTGLMFGFAIGALFTLFFFV